MDSALASSEAQSLHWNRLSVMLACPEALLRFRFIPSERDENKGKIRAKGWKNSLRPLLAKDFYRHFSCGTSFPEKLFHVGNLDLKNLHPNFLRMGKVRHEFCPFRNDIGERKPVTIFSDSINNSVSNTQKGTSVSQSNGVNQNSGSSFGFNGSGWNMGTNDSNGSYSAWPRQEHEFFREHLWRDYQI